MEASAQSGEALPTIELADDRCVATPVRRLPRRRVPRPTRRPSRGPRPVAIIGSGESAIRGASLLCATPAAARRCTVVFDTRVPSRARHEPLALPVRGPLAHVTREELREIDAEFVLAFAPDDVHHAAVATWRLIDEDLDFCVMPESLGCVYPLLRQLGWEEVPVVRTTRGAWQMLAHAWKRATDVVIALVTLTLLLPLLLLVALLIRLGSPGPVIFRQERVGKNGRRFRILKFRTMADGAHEQEASLRQECSADPRFIKFQCDPRVTRLGRILRKTSVDEFPQLWNVLRGDMSLVGPRPSQPSEVEHYEPDHFTRLLVKPGVTGMWQVSGRSALCFEDAVKLDAAYVRDWNPWLDLKILVKTVAVVLQCRGAC